MLQGLSCQGELAEKSWPLGELSQAQAEEGPEQYVLLKVKLSTAILERLQRP